MSLDEISKFKIDGTPIFNQIYGNGHINTTYLVLDDTARLYILQKINKNVFKNPQAVMENIDKVCAHLAKKGLGFRETLSLIPCEGKMWHTDENGDCWRMYPFISDSIAFQTPGNNPEGFRIMHEAGLATGQFLCQLADFDASTLIETIPNFHNTPKRYEALELAVANDKAGRLATVVEDELDFAINRREFAGTLTNLQELGHLPVRVTHNDTKLNNILFDRQTRKAICVIDLDTIMPGLVANDFGDAIRFGANTAAEDCPDLSKVSFSLELYHAYAKGFLQTCGRILNEYEIKHLATGAKMMTLECGVRFLTDYLNGDEYFKIHHPDHNLDRCRVQFKLVSDMEKNWDKMQIKYKGA